MKLCDKENTSEDIPLVSICCVSYNHAAFIRQCLDGFFMQDVSFPVEILIHDDASTDGIDRIIQEYTSKYPNIIKPLYETENQYTKPGHLYIDFYNYLRAKGKYIAYCEGDDYWTDPLKLQKQVDFMESHPDYSVCFHRCQLFNENTGRFRMDGCGKFFRQGQDGIDITIEMFLKDWMTQPLSMIFRTESFRPEWQKRYKHYRDQHEIYHLLKMGKGYLFAFVGGVYRMHGGGIASQISQAEYCKVSLPIDREFYHKTHDPQARRIYGETLQCCVDLYAATNKCKAAGYALVELIINRQYKTFGKNIIRLLKG